MRPAARYYDEHEHERPWDYIKLMWEGGTTPDSAGAAAARRRAAVPGCAMSSWRIRWRCSPMGMRPLSLNGRRRPGAAAIESAGTPEQRERFLARFQGGEPKWGAMAMTEPQAGSDTANIRTTAVLSEDGSEWILNGEKIFVTNGLMAAQESPGLLVVWQMWLLDRRAGMKSFVVEANTPGMQVEKLEKKLGIRASDTAAITFTNCRIPRDNILGSPDVARAEAAGSKGFRGAMKTFDATRPLVAASAIGVGRAALDFTKGYLAEHQVDVDYGTPASRLLAVEKDVMRMESQLRSAWLLTLRAAWQIDQGISNSMEASMCKVKAGEAVTLVTQKRWRYSVTKGTVPGRWWRNGCGTPRSMTCTKERGKSTG